MTTRTTEEYVVRIRTTDWIVTFTPAGTVGSVHRVVRGRRQPVASGVQRMQAIKQAANIRAIRRKAQDPDKAAARMVRREERAAAAKAKQQADLDALRQQVAASPATVPMPAAATLGALVGYWDKVQQASGLAYLWRDQDRRAVPFELSADTECTIHDGSCIVRQRTLPAGWRGWVVSSTDYAYSRYVWVGDEQYPAEDATRRAVRTYYTFLALVPGDNGQEVLVSSFKTVEYPQKGN